MERTAVIFEGRVQGVGFRFAAREVAERFAVTGWVRNEPDGAVRLEVQGQAPEVNAMIDALRSRMAGYIREARTEPMIPSPGETDFGIRR
jgi:acylphosphatase